MLKAGRASGSGGLVLIRLWRAASAVHHADNTLFPDATWPAKAPGTSRPPTQTIYAIFTSHSGVYTATYTSTIYVRWPLHFPQRFSVHHQICPRPLGNSSRPEFAGHCGHVQLSERGPGPPPRCKRTTESWIAHPVSEGLLRGRSAPGLSGNALPTTCLRQARTSHQRHRLERVEIPSFLISCGRACIKRTMRLCELGLCPSSFGRPCISCSSS